MCVLPSPGERSSATPREAAEAEPACIAAGHPPGVVRVSAFQSAFLCIVSPVVAALAQSSPDIRVEATELEVEEGVPALRLQQLDARVDKALCTFARRSADQTEADQPLVHSFRA